MRLIENIDELKSNLNLVEHYLREGSKKENEYVKERIAGGRCFFTYKTGNELRFAPSRFIGYYNNNMTKHKNNPEKDGRITNKAISRIFGYEPVENNKLDEKFLIYCSSIGIKKHKYKRKFWLFGLGPIDFNININSNEGFVEGKKIERMHLARERNPAVIKKAKEKFISEQGRLFCQICNFDFGDKYGDYGKDFIEAHHTIPVSQMPEGHKTKIEDIVLVCSNCHRILHRTRPWLNKNELKKILK